MFKQIRAFVMVRTLKTDFHNVFYHLINGFSIRNQNTHSQEGNCRRDNCIVITDWRYQALCVSSEDK